jgi:hypothetical protein
MCVYHLSVHVPRDTENIISTGLAAAERVGFDVDRNQDTEHEEWPNYNGSYKNKTITGFQFDISVDREPYERVLSVGLGELLVSEWSDSKQYTEFVDGVIDLACELATAYDAEYVPLFWSDEHQDVAPRGMPFADHIDRVPALAVYSASLFEELGGFETLYGGPPWRYCELDSGHVFAMTADGPWQDTAFTDSERRDLHHGEANTGLEISDPFAVLATGKYGTDAVVDRADLAREFTNEALTLERVYRDESNVLRRVEDDSFVRRIIDDGEVIGDLPANVDEADEPLSALLEASIPPAFVRLDDPDGETVVSRVLALDTGANKHKLVWSLAQTAQSQDVSEEVLTKIDRILTELQRLDDEDGFDQYIKQNFL